MHAETKQKRNNYAETCTIIFFGQAGLIETLKIFRTVSEVYLQKKIICRSKNTWMGAYRGIGSRWDTYRMFH